MGTGDNNENGEGDGQSEFEEPTEDVDSLEETLREVRDYSSKLEITDTDDMEWNPNASEESIPGSVDGENQSQSGGNGDRETDSDGDNGSDSTSDDDNEE